MFDADHGQTIKGSGGRWKRTVARRRLEATRSGPDGGRRRVTRRVRRLPRQHRRRHRVPQPARGVPSPSPNTSVPGIPPPILLEPSPDGGLDGLSWVFNAYAIVFAVLLVPS